LSVLKLSSKRLAHSLAIILVSCLRDFPESVLGKLCPQYLHSTKHMIDCYPSGTPLVCILAKAPSPIQPTIANKTVSLGDFKKLVFTKTKYHI
jgi:hypothetical protein